MDQSHFAELIKKVQDSSASADEKLELLKELNAEVPQINEMLKEFLEKLKEKANQ